MSAFEMKVRYAHLAPSQKVNIVDVLDSDLNKATAQLVHNQEKKTVSGVLQ